MLNSKDYKEIAKLHYTYISEGFLRNLGISFLAFLYETIDKDNNSIIIIEKFNDKIIGFVCGTSNLSSIFKRMALSPFRVIYILGFSIFSLSNLNKILELILHAKKKKFKNITNFELLSIVVEKNFQGQGCAQKLFLKLKSYFELKGAVCFKIIVGSNLNKANNFYLKMGSRPLKNIQVHDDVKSTIYLNFIKKNYYE